MRILLFALLFSSPIAAPALACGAGKGFPAMPKPAASIDRLLPQAHLSEADAGKVKELRANVAALVAAGDEKEARKVEEEAMRILGYKRVWLRCGRGSFAWVKLKQPI